MVEPPHRGSRVRRVSGATPQMQPTLPSDSSKAASLCVLGGGGGEEAGCGLRLVQRHGHWGGVSGGAGAHSGCSEDTQRPPQEKTAVPEPEDQRVPLGNHSWALSPPPPSTLLRESVLLPLLEKILRPSGPGIL